MRAHGATTRRVEDALAYLEELYPRRIGEACFIDRSGSENARVVRGRRASFNELSDDEEEAPFFAPAFAQLVGQVYQSAPYVSPDTKEWVISNATPLAGADGQRVAIVHYEVTVDSFRHSGAPAGNGLDLLVVDANTGAVVSDSARPQQVDAPLGVPDDRGFLPLASRFEADGITTLADGRRVAYQRLLGSAGNANDWVVIAAAPRGAGWGSGIGPAPLMLLLAAVLALVLGAAGFRAYQRALRASALHDALTGLPNRVLLDDRIAQALRQQARSGEQVAVMLLDLDRFKEINDTLGHSYGDELLRQVATRLTGLLRSPDTIARLGGDEFAVLLPDVADAEAAVAVAGRLLAALRETFPLSDVSVDVEASVGLALAPEHGNNPERLLGRADIAMYSAKTRRAGLVVYDPGDDEATPDRLALFGDLRRALDPHALHAGAREAGELVLHYQPKVDLALGELQGVEALVRWQHPTRGLVPPDAFIPIAESTGLIGALTVHVLDQALAQARTWLDAGQEVPVAVNASPRCLVDLGFPAQVLTLVRKHRVPPPLLRLEITESAVMTEPRRVLQVLTELHCAGVKLSIDDFGTGYSSMAYLKQLPVDELKIDRSFVRDMLEDPNDAVLVRSLVDLGHNLGLTIVAEGVEDADVAAALHELGCDVAQGYHYSRPVPPDALQLSDGASPAGPQAARR